MAEHTYFQISKTFIRSSSLIHLYQRSRHVGFVCFVALRPKSTAMVIAGWSVHLSTLFPGQAALRAHTLACH